MSQEQIYAAAILHDGKVYAMRPPNRHHNIIEMIHMTTGRFDQESEKGFVTNEGRFVNREEAAQIALETGQVEVLWVQPNQLFTEDLW